MGKEALVVKREILFDGAKFEGFLRLQEHDFVPVILNNHFYSPRGDILEHDKSLKQVIPYIWIVNPVTREVFLYQRGENKNKAAGEFKEERYLGKYSGGVGGHIDRDTEEGTKNPIEAAMMREFREEIITEIYPKPKVVGYINDDSDSIGSVHFGLVAIVETTVSVKAKPKEGLMSGKFYSFRVVDAFMSDPLMQVENWTKISWPFVKNYLLSLK